MNVNEDLNFSFDLNDEEVFTFSEDRYLNKKKKNTSSLYKIIIPINKKVDNKKKHIIRIPLCSLNSNNTIIDDQKVNLIKKKLVEIENELSNISLDSDSDKKENEQKEFNNLKSVLFSYEIFSSENKLLIQEKFDLLNFIITNLTKVILLMNKKSKIEKKKKENSILGIYDQIKAAIKLIEQLNVNMNNYFLKIFSLKNTIKEVKHLKNFKNNLNKDTNSFKNFIDKEYKFYKENYLLLTKIKKYIPYLCDKIIINCQNQNDIKEVV